MDLALNNQQWLMCHQTKPNIQTFKYIIYIYEVLSISFQTFFVWALLLIVHT